MAAVEGSQDSRRGRGRSIYVALFFWLSMRSPVAAGQVLRARPRLISNAHSHPAQIVAATLAFAFAAFPAKADAAHGDAAKESCSHPDMSAQLAVARFAEVIGPKRSKDRPATKLLDERG